MTDHSRANPQRYAYDQVLMAFNKAKGAHTILECNNLRDESKTQIAALDPNAEIIASHVSVNDQGTVVKYLPKLDVFILLDDIGDDEIVIGIKASSHKKMAKTMARLNLPRGAEQLS
jgi:hypothetical protein